MVKAALYTAGGITLGTGILLFMMGGAGVPGGDAALVFGTLGFDGLDELGLTARGPMALGLMAIGLALLVGTNFNAWKETGGY